VPGVTTVLGLLNKPALVPWANRLGLEGIDAAKYRDNRGEIGTLAHELIMGDLLGVPCDTSEYSRQQIDAAGHSFAFYQDWCKGKILEPIILEFPMVSEKYRYGGTLDYYGKVNNVVTLLDYKTGGVWTECYLQVSAYFNLLVENGFEPPEKITILSIPRDSGEQFQEIRFTNYKKGFQAFLLLRELYDLLKEF